MVNILVPMAGSSEFFSEQEYPFPKPLIEVRGKLMIEYVLESLNRIKGPKRFIFVVNQKDCAKYYLDNTLKLLTDNNCLIIKQDKSTAGGLCSCLLAVEQINNDTPLIISNSDQFLDVDVDAILQDFKEKDLGGGVICFESVHPKWSYVRLDSEGLVVETAEKNPISKNAIAGFYYFAQGADFVRASMRSILNDSHINGRFYVAPTYNELILEGHKLGIARIPNARYHSFYSAQKIQDFENGERF